MYARTKSNEYILGIGVLGLMDNTMELDQGVSKDRRKKDVREFFDEMDMVRGSRQKAESRESRKKKRVRALSILNRLIVDYGDIGNVPESNPSLKQAREWLGVYDDDIQETNVMNLRQRVAKLARKHKLRQSDIYKLLGYYLDVSMQTVKDKTYNNRFTVVEVTLVWNSLAELERTDNLSVLVRAYETRNAKEKDILERRERYKQKQQSLQAKMV